jgi:glc operon protein GlcG
MKVQLTILSLITVGTLALARAEEHADKGPVAVKRSLTLEGARSVGDAAAQFAKANGAGPSIAVVDDGGHLLYFTRPESSFAAGASVSLGKARTAAIFKKPTRDFEDTINKGRFTMTALPDFTPLQGGVPIVQDGQVIGAIGVSGAKSAAQDEEVARAGAAVLATNVAAKMGGPRVRLH